MKSIGIVALSLLTLAAGGGCSGRRLWTPDADDVGAQRAERAAKAMEEYEEKRTFAQYQAALGRLEENDPAGCRELAELLLARAPDHRECRLLAAEACLQLQEPGAAAAHLMELERRLPDDAEVQHALALAREAEGDDDAALAHYERAARLAPEDELLRLSYEDARDTVRR